MNTHVLIADSSSLIVFGAEMLLRPRQNTTVSTACSGDDLVRLARELEPDIIIAGTQVDPALDALALVEQLQQAAPQSRIMLMSFLSDGLVIHDLLAMGVRGYLYMEDDLRENLLTAVDAVLKGRLYLSPTANSEYLISVQSGRRSWKLDAQARAVLRFLAQGYSVGHIALELKLSPRRVYWERQKLRKRFGASTNEHLIRRAVEEGFGRFAD